MKNTDTPIHRTAEATLRAAGFTPLRQFVPSKDDAIGKGELFEIWAKDGVTVVVHFYSDSNGVEFYGRMGGNTWSGAAEALKELAP